MIELLLLCLFQIGMAITVAILAIRHKKRISLLVSCVGLIVAPLVWVSLVDLCLDEWVRFKWARLIIAWIVAIVLMIGMGGFLGFAISQTSRLVYPFAFWVFLPIVSIVVNRLVAVREKH